MGKGQQKISPPVKRQKGQELQNARRRQGEFAQAMPKTLGLCCPVNCFQHLSKKQLLILALTVVGIATIAAVVMHSHNAPSSKLSSSELTFFQNQIANAPTTTFKNCRSAGSGENTVEFCQMNRGAGDFFLKQYSLAKQKGTRLDRIYQSFLSSIQTKPGETIKNPDEILTASLTSLSQNNFRLLQSIDIVVPNINLVRYKQSLFAASKAIPGYINAMDICTSKTFQDFYYDNLEKYPTEPDILFAFLRKTFGEEELAKLFVAGTFIGDIWNHTHNWGVVKNDTGYQLAIIDADISPPPTEIGYYRANIDTFANNLLEQNLLSIPLLEKIKSLFESLQKRHSPQISPAVDLPEELYQQLLKTYVEICTKTLEEVRANPIAENSQGKLIGGLFLKHLTHALEEAQEDSKFKHKL